ncbi:hypothetical protein [Nonomuraea sp. NPDC002799]
MTVIVRRTLSSGRVRRTRVIRSARSTPARPSARRPGSARFTADLDIRATQLNTMHVLSDHEGFIPRRQRRNSMNPDPATSVPPWYAWNDGPKPARSWPSPKADVDVHRDQLKRVGLEMLTDTGVHNKEQVEMGLDSLSGLPARFDYFGADFYAGHIWREPVTTWAWGSMTALAGSVSRFSKAVQGCARLIRGSYENLGDMVFATGVNYDRAEGIFDKNLSSFTGSNLGRGTTHMTRLITSKYPWEEEDVSSLDAPLIKDCLNAVNISGLNSQADYCTQLADYFTDLQETVEGRARQLSNAWPGQTSEFALEALRKVQASCRTLAYATGTTSGTLSWLAGVVQQYQDGFEDTVKLGDHEFDDDLPNWMLPSGGGAHDRARAYLRELNTHLAIAYDMLPDQIEILLPGVPDSASAPDYNEADGLKDDSGFWSSLESGFNKLQKTDTDHKVDNLIL